MNPTFKSAMLAATQLTAAGDVNAATAMIQRALAGCSVDVPAQAARHPQYPASSSPLRLHLLDSGDVIDVEASWVDTGTVAKGPATGKTVTGKFGNEAGRREYLLYVPRRSQYEAPTAGLPLVVMLHGCTQTPADFAAGTAMNRLADRQDFLVLYPGQSRTANQSVCWNWFKPGDQGARAGEPSIIADMTRDIVARYRLDERRVYVAGLSAGGAMAAILANTYPDLFAAAGVHSGLPVGAAHDLPSALAAMKRGAAARGPLGSKGGFPVGGTQRNASPPRAVPTIVFHGKQDRTVHPSNAEQIVNTAVSAWPDGALTSRQEAGRAPRGRAYTRTIHADAAGNVMVERWEVQGAGHAWSGGDPQGSYTDAQGPDASAEMVRFFLSR